MSYVFGLIMWPAWVAKMFLDSESAFRDTLWPMQQKFSRKASILSN